MDALQLIGDLQATLRAQIERAKEIRVLPAGHLLHRLAPDKWNIVEVFEHMNLSSGTYLKGLRRAFDERAGRFAFNAVFTPGLLGRYFTKSMLPLPDGRIRNRMKTLRMFEPKFHGGATSESIDRFVRMCEEFIELLDRARHTDLGRIKVTSSLGPIVRFKAGDAFRFPVAHQQRHFLQIERTLASGRG